MAVFVRSEDEIARAEKAVGLAGLSAAILDERPEGARCTVAIATMHLAKGLEFRAVAVMACDDEILPLQSRIENVADKGPGGHLRHGASPPHMACTWTPDRLLMTGVEPASEFLDDLRMEA